MILFLSGFGAPPPDSPQENKKHTIPSGIVGVRFAGDEEEVVAILGKPKSINELGPLGSFDYVYDDVNIRFLDFEVAPID